MGREFFVPATTLIAVKLLRARPDSVALRRLFLFPLDCIARRYHFLLQGIAYFSILMSSGKRKNGADARAKTAALLFVACERNPDPTGRLSIPNVLRVKGYSEDEAVNRTLQMQVRREVEKLKGNSSALATATAMIMLSTTTTTITTTTSTATTISTISSESLDLPSPLKKTRKMSHQRQIYHQNKRKAKEGRLWHEPRRSLPLRGGKRRRMLAQHSQSS